MIHWAMTVFSIVSQVAILLVQMTHRMPASSALPQEVLRQELAFEPDVRGLACFIGDRACGRTVSDRAPDIDLYRPTVRVFLARGLEA